MSFMAHFELCFPPAPMHWEVPLPGRSVAAGTSAELHPLKPNLVFLQTYEFKQKTQKKRLL